MVEFLRELADFPWQGLAGLATILVLVSPKIPIVRRWFGDAVQEMLGTAQLRRDNQAASDRFENYVAEHQHEVQTRYEETQGQIAAVTLQVAALSKVVGNHVGARSRHVSPKGRGKE